jgi:proline iminopeptidase
MRAAKAAFGRYDWVCPPAASRAIAAGVPSGRLVVLPDAGHFGFCETPEPFLAAVRAQLADASSARQTDPPASALWPDE